MRLKGLTLGLAAAVAATGIAAPAVQAADTQFFPLFTYRTGPYAPNGIPSANGIADYLNYVNLKHGGVNGVKLVWEECETGYNTKKGVECYERLKGKGTTVVFPYSTGITYKLIPNANKDKISILTVGYGRTDASDGRVFPWTFTTPTTYWSQASAFVKYIGAQEGGMGKLKGKKIALIYHNSAYGKEPIRTLKLLERKLGYKLTTLAVNHPGQEQKATWLQIRKLRPDWILLWGWGVMNQVSIKEATNIGFKMDRMIGVWWSGAEQDVVPTGDAAKGYKAGTFHAAGGDFPLIKDIKKVVYDAGKGIKGGDKYIGQVLWNRGMVNAIFATEAMRAAQKKYGVKVVNGDQMRWGLENLNITAERWAELGLKGFMQPVKNTCADHEGNGPVLIQQWDGKKWNIVSDFISPMREVIRPLIEKSAAAYAKKNKITPRKC